MIFAPPLSGKGAFYRRLLSIVLIAALLLSLLPFNTVRAAASAAVLGKIEAENWTAMSGVQTESTADTGGGLDVGWTDAGDWMDYSVDVASSGTYTVDFRVASKNGGGQIQLQDSGGTVLTSVYAPNTGAWQWWTTVSATANLSAGPQTLRVYAVNGGFNINWINFTATPSATITSLQAVNVTTTAGSAPVLPTVVTAVYSDSSTNQLPVTWNAVAASQYATAGSFTVNGTVPGTAIQAVANVTVVSPSAAVPGKIEAENWSAMSGVQTESTADTGGGLNVGWIDTGDWMDYKVNVASAGAYTVDFRVASKSGGGKLQLQDSSGAVLTNVDIPSTGYYQWWTTVSATTHLNAGTQTLRVYAAAGGFNINWMNFSIKSYTPTGLYAFAGNTNATIGWTAVSDATSYNVKRSTVSGGPYQQIANVALGSYMASSLVNGTTYYYVISAVTAYGESSDSVQIAVTPVAAASTVLKGTARDSQVTLQWDIVQGADTYDLLRSDDGGATYTIIAPGLTTTTYTDAGLNDGTNYQYVVQVKSAGALIGNSSAMQIAPITPLASPLGLSAAVGNSKVDLTWISVAGATSYTVKRSTLSGRSYSVIASKLTAPAFTDTTVANGSTYFYVVSASNAQTESMNSNQVIVSPFNIVPGAPLVPDNVTATAGNNRVALQWNTVSGASSYHVKRAASFTGPYTTIANVTGTEYSDIGLTNGNTYFYAVSAFNAIGEGASSAALSTTPANVIVVSKDGTGNFTTVTDAVYSIPGGQTTRQVIYIRNGVYREKITIPSNKPYISFVGESRDGTIITYDDYANAIGTSKSFTVMVSASDFSAENLTIQNAAYPRTSVGPAVALYMNADRAIFTNVRLAGYQDTLYTNSGRQYYKNSIIEGDVDWIFGNANAIFDNSEIKMVGNSGGYVTAASTDQFSAYGYTFLNSRLTRGTSFLKNSVAWDPAWDIDKNISATNNTTDLGRPWRAYANVKFINTWMDAHIHATGWFNWGNPANELTARYGEYNSSGPGANPKARYKWTSQLSPGEANQYTVQNIFAGTDGWDPTLFGTLPRNTLSNEEKTFDRNILNQADIPISMQISGDTVTGITYGTYSLLQNTDYSINGSIYTIKKSFLTRMPIGTNTLTFMFSSGKTIPFNINVVNTTPLPGQTIANVPALQLYTIAGVAPYLPSIVPVRFTDQSEKALPVTWDSLSPTRYATVGSFSVQGVITGTNVPVTANVTVQALNSVGAVTGGDDLQSHLTNLPFDMPAFMLYTFPDLDFNIKDYGAVGDGVTKNTEAFAKAIAAAAANPGGGRVVVPAGVWYTGPIVMQSNVNLHLEDGAKILFSSDYSDYQQLKGVKSLISGVGLHNIALTGNGVIDGNGLFWRPVKKSKVTTTQWNYLLSLGGVLSDDGSMWYPSGQAVGVARPLMVDISSSSNVLLDGPTLMNSPTFAASFTKDQYLVIRNSTVNNDAWYQNADGLDVTSSQYVAMYHNTVNAGDDAIGMKSSNDPSPVNTQANVVVEDNIVFRGHGGVSFGSNTSGGIKNLAIRNNQFIGTDAGINIKSYVGGGGPIENIYIDGIHMQNIGGAAISISDFYKGHDAVLDNARLGVDDRVPEIKNIHISNITVDGADQAVSIDTLVNVPLHDIDFTNMKITAKEGWVSSNTANVKLNNVQIIPAGGTVFTFTNASDILFNNVLCPPATSTFIHLSGAASHIQLQNTDYSKAGVPFLLDQGISQGAIRIIQLPYAPANLSGITGNSQVYLTWDSVPGADYYNVKRSTASGTGYQTIASNVTSNTYLDAGLDANSTYDYIVTAVNASGESEPSNGVVAKFANPADGLPIATITEIPNIFAGQSFTMTYGLNNISSNVISTVYSQDITFQYNPDLLEFSSAESLFNEVIVASVSNDPAGKVRILLSSTGDSSGVNTSGDLLKLNWRVKAFDQPGNVITPIYLSKAVIKNAEGAESVLANTFAAVHIMIDQSALDSKIMEVKSLNAGSYTPASWTVLQTYVNTAISIQNNALSTQAQVNAAANNLQIAQQLLLAPSTKTSLSSKISDAKAIISSASAGDQWGQYTQSVIDVLSAAIGKATTVLDNPDADQAAVDQAAVDLEIAMQNFLISANHPRIGDLTAVSAHYGMNSASAGWAQVQKYDINQDGRLDIADLAAIARNIVNP